MPSTEPVGNAPQSGAAQRPPVIQPPIPILRGWPGLLCLFGAAIAGALVLYFFNPAQHGFYPFCLLNRMTGLRCPGCGSLRALHHLLHGDLAAAFRMNAMLIVGLPVVAWLALRAVLARFAPRFRAREIRPALLWTGFAIALAFGVLRNFSGAGF